MSEYNHNSFEPKWQKYWQENNIYKVDIDKSKPKYYALDMFPYPSGAGLHVGHPMGYIASDIVSRFKRLKGFNVLHPMGFDSFGLPAEQYAIETGQHPAITTEANIKTFKGQMNKIGFSFDWSREVQTSSPEYYRWTQWIFEQLFNAWYDKDANKAKDIKELIALFEANGSAGINAEKDDNSTEFTAAEWKNFSEAEKATILLQYRLTFLSEAMVNWCPALGTVLANDEVKDGVSERGGHPVERKKMKQWMMRITAYADRLLGNLDGLNWSDALKEMQRNWIGKSIGCELDFKVAEKDITLTAFTTRVDTIFGVSYVVIAPEHELVAELTTDAQKTDVEAYVETAKNRSERDRQSDVKTVSGVFTGSHVINPITGEEVPLWIADYVLSGYGTGVVMAVPSSDDRDFRFAEKFDLPIIRVIEGTEDMENPTEVKRGKMINSGFLNGLETDEAIRVAIDKALELGVGKQKVNFRIRDAVFSRQRYWGEPVPVYFDENDNPQLVPDSQLPLNLPEVENYLPTEDGDPPLGNAKDWKFDNKFGYELTTMPGWAGSSWYFLRYMDPQNKEAFVSKEAAEYWNQVDLYVGGTEHATGHLLYSRFWNMFLYDMGFISHEEPFKRIVNQGMIQGRSNFVYRVKGTNQFVSYGLRKDYDVQELYVDVNIVTNDELDTEAFKKWRPDYANAEFILEDGKYMCGSVVEKMSKSKYNVVNPDVVIEKYGADTLRLYEMFLGPVEQSKPWSMQGIDGVWKFLRKLWRLFYTDEGKLIVVDGKATDAELKILHKTIKKAGEDMESLSLNTTVPAFMVCVNELAAAKCHKKEVLEQLLIIVSPFAPHIAEELWQDALGHTASIVTESFPEFNPALLVEASHTYPVSINGKMRVKLDLPMDISQEDAKAAVFANEVVQKWVEDKPIKKFIFVPKRIVNIVV
ncbi:leucine--tRNA ligase [Flammeovirga kamogawensis]|uniref:Leucine--tRNA ligase n=1 Tax=Flammeovirga kamogawensis TaxID=373891 RepID=A0ABX8GVY8_9BACT|nr:leucine--tRNA ligase [Flammeovirga kamogawensis]MBB6461201.1 leucyl-tRNA synthetase [Flammeovirga kamogawensis]QWG07764.1 leucine--tRNA ligase [Flammeovirga kamogawensis]TRX69570.1 leucine--tRNA ligase [Flammeovirga kamogawensis]